MGCGRVFVCPAVKRWEGGLPIQSLWLVWGGSGMRTDVSSLIGTINQ